MIQSCGSSNCIFSFNFQNAQPKEMHFPSTSTLIQFNYGIRRSSTHLNFTIYQQPCFQKFTYVVFVITQRLYISLQRRNDKVFVMKTSFNTITFFCSKRFHEPVWHKSLKESFFFHFCWSNCQIHCLTARI